VRIRRHAAAETRAAAPAPAEDVSTNDTLAREIPLIDAGRSELAATPSRALATLEIHRREFPRGQLAAEREFLAVQALVQMNRIEDAKRRAEELATRFPASSYAARAKRSIREVEAQGAASPTSDESRGTQRPFMQHASDRL
jgi:TolA-binding protein